LSRRNGQEHYLTRAGRAHTCSRQSVTPDYDERLHDPHAMRSRALLVFLTRPDAHCWLKVSSERQPGLPPTYDAGKT